MARSIGTMGASVARAGAAVIGLAWSDDLLHWELTEPILFPQDGAPWEHGGLYRPSLLEQDGVFYLYCNAKTDLLPKSQGGGWREQSGVATSCDLKTWTRYSGNPVLPNGGPDSWDARFASNPFIVRQKGLWECTTSDSTGAVLPANCTLAACCAKELWACRHSCWWYGSRAQGCDALRRRVW